MIKEAYCLFEQSGTFKNEFKKFDIPAYDVDILNEFEETDYQIDLFAEIQKAYKNEEGTIFEKFNENTLIFAFFPCTRFTEKTSLNSKCDSYFMRDFTPIKKLEYTKNITSEMIFNYHRLCELCILSHRIGFPLIIENPLPNNSLNFLKLYFPFNSQVKILDRSDYGDWYKKPTQFWFFNCEPQYNFIFENIAQDAKTVMPPRTKREDGKIIFQPEYKPRHEIQVERSLISPLFANRFIREFILEEKDE